MILRALFTAALMLFCSSASAQVLQGAAAVAATAARTYSQAEILAMFGSTPVQSGTATLRGGALIPVFVTGVLIGGALNWFYQQAQDAATGTSLDEYNKWGAKPAPAVVPSPNTTSTRPKVIVKQCWNNGYFSTYFYEEVGTDSILSYVQIGSNPGTYLGNPTKSAGIAALQNGSCDGAANKPSLPDFIRGTYPNGTPHPDAINGINQALRGYIPTIPMPQPVGAPDLGIKTGTPVVAEDTWADGCPSGSDWSSTTSSCAVTPDPDPEPEPCPAGQTRPAGGGACAPTPDPQPEPCPAGQTRPAGGGACAPTDPTLPPPGNYPCPDMAGSGDLIGFVGNFFPNFVSLTRCMFVPTRDIPARVGTFSAFARTKFPFSVAAQLQTAFAPVAMSGDASVLPTNAGMFTLDWAWLSPLWAVCKAAIGSFIWFSALWFIWGKLSPQVTV